MNHQPDMMEFFLKKKVLVNLLTIFTVATGITALFYVKRATYPNVDFDILKMTTECPGVPHFLLFNKPVLCFQDHASWEGSVYHD